MKGALLRFAFLFLCAVASEAIAQSPPLITSVPGSRQVVMIGQSLTLSVAATGTSAPTYQWKRNGRPIPGATSRTYTVAKASPLNDNGWYQVVVSNTAGTATSAVVFVNVVVYPANIMPAGNYGAPVPTPENLTAVIAVAVGAGHWLALKGDGTVAAWGYNAYGQTTVPANLTDVVAIAACNYTSFALRANGSVVAWGDNGWKQTTLPAGLANVVSIAAGQSHGLALKTDGTVVGWGWNPDGQASPPPQLNNVVSIAAGENNSFAIKADGTAVGWGNTFAGNPNVLASLTGIVDVASGEDFSIALTTLRRITGWAPGYSGTGIPPDDLTDVVGIAAGLGHALALKADGTVISWGETYTGPAAVFENATNIVAIDAKDGYSVALRHSLEDEIVPGPAYTFTTLAGQAGHLFDSGIDGTGTDARFGLAAGIAVDGSGNVFVADYMSHTLRKVTPGGVVTTFAGIPGTPSYTKGPGGSPTTFSSPTGVAVDDDVVYVADAGGYLIRKVTPDGVITVLAGNYGMPGSANGTGTSAQFEVPNSIAVDRAGNIYVADSEIFYLGDGGNNTIRKVTPAGVVTTLAGTPRQTGSADGTGGAAQFGYGFSGIAVDDAGNVYVADTRNHTIRKITPNGVVTTLAGQAGSIGMEDGVGSAARFYFPYGLTIDRSGNIFVTDGANRSIRKITPDGVVSHVMNASGGVADFLVSGITVDDAGNLYVISNNVILKGVPVPLPAPVTIKSQPRSQTVADGSTVVLSVQASGTPSPTYQWTKDGAILPGATGATLVIPGTTAAHAGNYAVSVTNSSGTITSDTIALTLSSTANVGRLINLSTRAPVGTGAQTLNLGFVLGGGTTTTGTPVLLRAIGPSLAPYDVPGIHLDPTLEFYAAGAKIDENNDWGGDPLIATASEQVGAFPFAGAASTDAALYMPSCAPGLYTIVLSGPGSANGVVLAEVYDATPAGSFSPDAPQLINSSARAYAGTGNDVLIAGFVIDGETSKTVLLRAIGPSLVAHGIDGVLADPKLQLFSGSTKILENDNWNTDPAVTADLFASAGAFALPPDSKDAALLITLPPGAYTAHVSGANGGTGVALAEIYVIP